MTLAMTKILGGLIGAGLLGYATGHLWGSVRDFFDGLTKTNDS
jgi:hypothetical protein